MPARAAGRFSSPVRLETWTGVFWILGMKPRRSSEKSSASPLFSTTKLVSVRLAVVHEGEGDLLVEVEEGADVDLLPGGIVDGVVVDDGVAGLDAGAGDGGFLGDVIGRGGTGEVLLHLVVEHGDAGHEEEGEDEVGDGTGEGDEDALPAGVGVELAQIA